MTQIKVDTVTNAAGTGAPDFADGVTYEGGALSTLNTFEYYSTGTEPESANDGAIWWDTGNDKIFMFIADEWKEIDLGASAGGASWTVDLSNVTYGSVSFSVNSQDTNPLGLSFSNDGTKMYVVGDNSNNIYQYSLSTAFDLSTASYDSVSFSMSAQGTFNSGVRFNADGTKMYIVDYFDSNLDQYSLSTAFDLSTASYDSVSFSVVANPFSLAFNTDGTKMYVLSYTAKTVYQYSLSTGFDLSTASSDNVSFSVANEAGLSMDLAFNTDGTKMYIVDFSGDDLYQYSLTTGFDLSTASYDSVSLDISSQDTSPRFVFFSTDGTKMYMLGTQNNTVYQYSTGL